MNNLINIYQDNLYYVFKQNQLINKEYTYLVVIKDGCDITPVDNTLIMHYSDDFESLLNIKLPTKNNKTKQLITLSKCNDIIDRVTYGTLSFSYDDIPYAVGLDHIVIDNHIYFHCATKGFKLNGINSRVNYLVVEDLGINEKVGTHNFRSVSILGKLKEVKDFDTKKAALLELVASRAPSHPFNDKMVEATTILEIEEEYIIGKEHIR